MQALSIKQPWAWLIVNGYKDVENRTWATKKRGFFLVHASKKIDKEGYVIVKNTYPNIELPDINNFQTGGIVGLMEIVDCVKTMNSPWFCGPYGLVLKNCQTLPFANKKGMLGFFNCDNYLLEKFKFN